MTDETVEPLPSTQLPAPDASDVSFWNSNSYRSGGDDWNQFLDIDSSDSPMAELAELAAFDAADSPSMPEMEPAEPEIAPVAVATGFEFLAGNSDDLLPDR